MKMSIARGMMNQAWLYSGWLQASNRGFSERHTPANSAKLTTSANKPKFCQSVRRKLTATMVAPAGWSEFTLFMIGLSARQAPKFRIPEVERGMFLDGVEILPDL